MIDLLNELRPQIHMLLHGLVPAIVALLLYRRSFWAAFSVMMATMAVDLDHLWAEPRYDPDRCSIGFHPLHLYPMLPVYLIMALLPLTRWVGLGLVIHMLLDGADCWWMQAW